MAMFCYQCQETARGTGCEVKGVCGKSETLAKLMDLLMYSIKGLSYLIVKNKIDPKTIAEVNHITLSSLFMTITNANFDEATIWAQVEKVIAERDKLAAAYPGSADCRPADFKLENMDKMLEMASGIGVLATQNEDIRSLREIIIYGLKGMAAYTEHAVNLGKEDYDIYAFMYEALSSTLDDTLPQDKLVALVLKTGEYGVKAMALLDCANTARYGNPEVTKVNIGARSNPAILVSGHDLVDLEQLLEQTQGAGVDVYTHGEMLPAHSYPYFKKYPHLVGNYGNAWWKQITEFATFRGPILFTTNCIVPPKSEEIRQRIYTTGSAGYPGCVHIMPDKEGKKDFSRIIEHAKRLGAPEEIEQGEITGGFAHAQITALADKVVEAVKSGAIKKFFVMAGCDGRMRSREYYTEFAAKLPKDTVILTAGCAKYRYNKLGLGDIGGIPRVLDAGQCNDSYSLAVVALKLKEIFGLDDINKLPIVFNIAWYEQKAVIVLLALLYLGVKNIHLGPTLPGFWSANVLAVIKDAFNVQTISTADEDIAKFLP
jgi:hydroxylamine reductase